MKYKTILVTGGAGFVGSNMCVAFKTKYPHLKIIALDNLKRRGSELNLIRLKEHDINFVHGDIRNPEDLAFEAKIDLVLECSAEPSVLAGYQNPQYVISTNLTGTINCLELCRRDKADIIFLSTSRVYPFDALNGIKTKELNSRFDWLAGQSIPGWSRQGIGRDFTLDGAKTFYGATKLCSEIILQEYIDTYGIKGVINRCGVIGGPWQFGKVDQGIFTFWMLAHYFKKNVSYIGFGGKGKQVRDLLHVDDLFRLIDIQAKSIGKINGSVYNVGGGRQNSLSLLETSALCEKITGNRIRFLEEKKNRPGDVRIYIGDNALVQKQLGWCPKKSSWDCLVDIYRWIRDNETQIRSI